MRLVFGSLTLIQTIPFFLSERLCLFARGIAIDRRKAKWKRVAINAERSLVDCRPKVWINLVEDAALRIRCLCDQNRFQQILPMGGKLQPMRHWRFDHQVRRYPGDRKTILPGKSGTAKKPLKRLRILKQPHGTLLVLQTASEKIRESSRRRLPALKFRALSSRWPYTKV